MGAGLLAGVDVGGTKCAVVLARPSAVPGGEPEVLGRTEIPTVATGGPSEVLAALRDALESLLAAAGPEGAAGVRIGISCGGPLDSRTGRILSPPNLPGWDDVPAVAFFREAFAARRPARVALENDANAGALAEWRYGAGRGASSLVFLTFGTGFGAGLVLDGRLYRGVADSAGEIGHVRLADHGPVGYGKAGSAEGFCSGGGLAQLARLRVLERLQRGERPALCPDPSALDGLTARTVADAADAGDPLALAIYRECGEQLGKALAILVDLLAPERIVIGSIFVHSRDLLWPAAQAVLAREALPRALAGCGVVPAALGRRTGDLAALAIAESED
jgi:glucokinase